MSDADQRDSKRKRTLLRAQIRFNNNNSIIDCTVWNLSETGARIFFEHPIQIPRDFDLEIPSKKLIYPCEVRWTRFQVHGVIFTNQPPTPGTSAAKAPKTVGPSTATSGGWLIKVSSPSEPPQVKIFVVAENKPSEALALVVKRVAATCGTQVAVEGPISERAIRLFGVEPGTALDLSPE